MRENLGSSERREKERRGQIWDTRREWRRRGKGKRDIYELLNWAAEAEADGEAVAGLGRCRGISRWVLVFSQLAHFSWGAHPYF